MAHLPTVLIVDDDPAIRKMLVEVLQLEGYPIETAGDGREALDLLARGGARVILLDLLMPVLDGRGMMEELRADPDERARHKVILVSAIHNLESARDLEPDGLLPKPFTVTQLLNVLEPISISIGDESTGITSFDGLYQTIFVPPGPRDEQFIETYAHNGSKKPEITSRTLRDDPAPMPDNADPVDGPSGDVMPVSRADPTELKGNAIKVTAEAPSQGKTAEVPLKEAEPASVSISDSTATAVSATESHKKSRGRRWGRHRK